MFAPEIRGVNISDEFENGLLTLNDYEFYDENSDEDLSTFQWYSSDRIDGEYTPITGAVDKTLTIDSNLKDKFVKLYITPVTNTYPYEGEVYMSPYYCRTYEPEAVDVKIIGEATIGTKLIGEYTYIDKNNASDVSTEEGTVVRWLIYDDSNSEPKDTGVNIAEYEIIQEDTEKLIVFEVTPGKNGLMGQPVRSAFFTMPAKPVAKNVRITGTASSGYTVSGAYDYSQASGAKEKATEFAWYSNGVLVSSEQNYTIAKSDEGHTLVFAVTPGSEKEPFKGDTVNSAGVTVNKTQSGSSTSSGGGGKGSGGSKGTSSIIGSGTIMGEINKNKENAGNNNNELITNFTDITDSLYKKEIVELYDKKIINGVSDTEFSPAREIKRAEYTALMVRMLNLNKSEYDGAFADVSKEKWYADDIETAYKAGLVNGFEGSFRPEDGITIEEIVKILVEVYEKKNGASEYDEDIKVHDVSEWAAVYAKKAIRMGIISDKEFILTEKARRDEAAALIYRYTKKAGDSI